EAQHRVVSGVEAFDGGELEPRLRESCSRAQLGVRERDHLGRVVEAVVLDLDAAAPQRVDVVAARATGVKQRFAGSQALREDLGGLRGARHLVGLAATTLAKQLERVAVVGPRVPAWICGARHYLIATTVHIAWRYSS